MSHTGRPDPPLVPLRTVVREWGRIGCTGFGGPPAHIRLLRELCVERQGWLDSQEFEDAIAACNLLPGPASTQLAIFCAWRLRGRAGALAGGAAFILPGLAVILALAALFLTRSPPLWVLGAGAGAGAVVPAVAVNAAVTLIGPSWRRRARAARWLAFVSAGAAGAVFTGPWLVLVLLACGLAESLSRLRSGSGPARPGPEPGGPSSAGLRGDSGRPPSRGPGGDGGFHPRAALALPLAAGTLGAATLLSVAWVAFKVGALSYGGGFVIIPLMQADVVTHYHWLTGAQFLNAVALGQITPGPVVQTVAVVGYAAAGLAGGLLASLVAFGPSFCFVLAGGSRFGVLRHNRHSRGFLDGAGPAAIGAIGGSALSLARTLAHPWQFAVLVVALTVLVPLRRGVVLTLLGGALAGVIIALATGTVAA